MVNKILAVAIAADVLFLASGVLELAFCLVTKSNMAQDPDNGEDAVRDLLHQSLPLEAGIANAAFILATFVATLPGLAMPTTRGWLKVSGYMIAFCAVFTMCVGVFLWVMTLTIGQDFASTYETLDTNTMDLIQTSFECCGYMDSMTPPFVTNPTCPSPAAAALLRGCQTSVSSFGNGVLDRIFTAVFGVVGIDAIFILALACLSKDRKEREWYRRIDQKTRS